MEHKNAHSSWETYRDEELAVVSPMLVEFGYILEERQPHISGERYLMQAVTTAHGKKLILLAKDRKSGKRVVIKITSDETGAKELSHERTCRSVLSTINFAYRIFFSPEELLFTTRGKYTISVQEFLEQECAFLERPIEEQFRLALSGFKAQEGAHAATYAHMRTAKKTFGSRDAKDYLANFTRFKNDIIAKRTNEDVLRTRLDSAEKLLREHQETIERYSGFLTHTDFVPHNFRIKDGHIYLLDHSSIVFGNKYEGWARFLNFMTLYNPKLEEVLVQYVKDNRDPEESRALMHMRVYRLAEIIWFYTDLLGKTSGDLRTLEEKRIGFWGEVLDATLRGQPLKADIRETYIKDRDALRSQEEKDRQVGLH